MSTVYAGPLLELQANGRDYFRNMPLGNDPDYVYYMNDFLNKSDYSTTNFTETLIDGGTDGAGSVTVLSTTKNGVLKILNNDADNDSYEIQMKPELFKLEADKKMWFETKCQVSDADAVDFFIGLSITDTTCQDSTDRIGFQVDDGSESILCETIKNSTTTSVDSQIDIVDATDIKLGFYWDGSSTVEFYVNRALVSSHTTNIPNDEELAISISLINGAAAAKNAIIDYILAVKER